MPLDEQGIAEVVKDFASEAGFAASVLEELDEPSLAAVLLVGEQFLTAVHALIDKRGSTPARTKAAIDGEVAAAIAARFAR